MKKNYWSCIIGPVDNKDLPRGSDATLRGPIREAFNKAFGSDNVCASGWRIDEEKYKLLRKLESLDTLTLKKILKTHEKA